MIVRSPAQITPGQITCSVSQQFREMIRQALVDLRVSIPAIVQSFDSGTQTVTVQIAIREQVQSPKGPVDTAIKPIIRVPLLFFSGGGFSVTLPVAPGDEGWLIFCDMCFDLWWARGGVQDQFAVHRHDVSDCGFYPGGRSQPRKLSNYSTASAQLRSDDGSVIVDLALTGITLTAPKVQMITTGDSDITATGKLNLSAGKISVGSLPVFASNLLALAGGLTAGDLYRNGADPDHICVVH